MAKRMRFTTFFLMQVFEDGSPHPQNILLWCTKLQISVDKEIRLHRMNRFAKIRPKILKIGLVMWDLIKSTTL